MPSSIGIRVEPRCVHFAIVERSTDSLDVVTIDRIIYPSALEIPDALHHMRSMFMDVVRLYGVSLAGIRTTEWNAQSHNPQRLGLEAVLQEAMAGGPIDRYFTGTLATIAKNLGLNFDASSLKAEIRSDGSSIGIEDWETLSEAQREALLTAIAAIGGLS